MKKNIFQYILIFTLLLILAGLSIWGFWFVEKIENQIPIFGIVAAIVAALTSVYNVSLTNEKAKEREFDLMLKKEKQKVLEHYYNALFEMFKNKNKKTTVIPPKVISETMLFKKGLMNWGSDKLIKAFIEYEDQVDGADTFNLIEDGNTFLKAMREEMGFNDPKELNLFHIILTSEARKEVSQNNTNALKK